MKPSSDDVINNFVITSLHFWVSNYPRRLPRGVMAVDPLVLGNKQREGWQAHANCMGVDPDLFFPERGASTREAKGVCQGCVVREDCLEYALANSEKFGIWGGMSERERRRLRRARSAAAAASKGVISA